jgi:hypothetical protein
VLPQSGCALSPLEGVFGSAPLLERAEFFGEDHGVFDGLAAALPQVGHHRVDRVA